MPRLTASILVASLALISASAGAQQSQNWDGLTQVKAKNIGAVYLLPGADFRTYSKVMIDPPEVAFRKDWQRGQNFSSRLSDAEMRRVLDEASVNFAQTLAKAHAKQRIEVVTQPGPDVLRLRTAIVNLSFVVPDRLAARSRTFAREAGEATLVLEGRDSISGALLGRAVDRELAGNSGSTIRDKSSIRADFEFLFEDWAKRVAKGFDQLKANSPVDPNGRVVR